MNKSISFYEAIIGASRRTYDVINSSFSMIKMIINNEISIKQLQGPVGIGHVASDIVKTDISSFIPLIAVISTSIGFINLLPVPILDGGHLLMFAFEGITKRKPNQNYMNYLAIIALSGLLTLIFFVSVNDILRLLEKWN